MAHAWFSTDHLFTILYLIGVAGKALLPRKGNRLLTLARAEAELLVNFCGEEKSPVTKDNVTGGKD